MMDFSPSEVLLAKCVRSILVGSSQIVGFVLECDLADQLVSHRTDENSAQVVIVLVPANLPTVLEDDFFVPQAVDCARLQAQVDGKFQVSRNCEVVVWTICNEVASRRVMTCLFQVESGAVLAVGFVCLSKDRVQRLGEELVVELPSKIRTHDKLQPLDRVRCIGCTIHVYRHR